jgi:ribosomal protein S3
VTDDSAFKNQVRARMTETGEKYTVARRIVKDQQLRAEAEAAEDTAIRGAVQRAIERVVGLSAVDVGRTADRVQVSIRAARPILITGPRGEDADRLRGELEVLTGRRVRLDIREAPSQQGAPENEGQETRTG